MKRGSTDSLPLPIATALVKLMRASWLGVEKCDRRQQLFLIKLPTSRSSISVSLELYQLTDSRETIGLGCCFPPPTLQQTRIQLYRYCANVVPI